MDPWSDDEVEPPQRRRIGVILVVAFVAAWAMIGLLWLAWGDASDDLERQRNEVEQPSR